MKLSFPVYQTREIFILNPKIYQIGVDCSVKFKFFQLLFILVF